MTFFKVYPGTIWYSKSLPIKFDATMATTYTFLEISLTLTFFDHFCVLCNFDYFLINFGAFRRIWKLTQEIQDGGSKMVAV